MRSYIYFVFALLFFASCGGEEKEGDISPSSNDGPDGISPGGIEITGTIENGAGQVINLQQIDPKTFRWNVIDVDTIDNNNEFSLTTTSGALESYSLGKQDAKSSNDFIFLFLQEGDKPVVNASISNLMYTYSVEGSPHSEIEEQYRSLVSNYRPTIDSLREVAASLPFEEADRRGQIISAIDEMKTKENEAVREFIVENKGEPGVVNAVLDYINPRRQGQSIQPSDMKLLSEVKDAVVESYPASTVANFLTRFDSQIKAEKQMAEQQKAQQEKMANLLKPGTVPPEISLPDPNGQTRSLSSMKGKVVLVDFWASWCRPCRAENPNVVRTYNKYKDSGFDIFSVSLDKDKQRWVQAIQKDGLVWSNHVSDLQGWQSSAAKTYNVTGIPFTVLLDKEGKVIATGLRGEALYSKLEEIFGF